MTQQRLMLHGAIGLAGLLTALAGPAANAATITSNTSLLSPNAADPDSPQTATNNSSYYAGSTGNPQGFWQAATEGNVELGLRAVLRFGGPSAYSSGNTYIVPTGVSGGRALWNYDFSIDLNTGGALGGLTFAALSAGGSVSLTVQDITAGGPIFSVDPTTHWTDNDSYGGGGTTNAAKHPNGGLPANVLNFQDDWGTQNSQNLSFPDGPLPGFNPWLGDTYRFTLTLVTPAGVTISDSIDVTAVPEPASMAVLGAGLVALGTIRRRRRQ